MTKQEFTPTVTITLKEYEKLKIIEDGVEKLKTYVIYYPDFMGQTPYMVRFYSNEEVFEAYDKTFLTLRADIDKLTEENASLKKALSPFPLTSFLDGDIKSEKSKKCFKWF